MCNFLQRKQNKYFRHIKKCFNSADLYAEYLVAMNGYSYDTALRIAEFDLGYIPKHERCKRLKKLWRITPKGK